MAVHDLVDGEAVQIVGLEVAEAAGEQDLQIAQDGRVRKGAGREVLDERPIQQQVAQDVEVALQHPRPVLEPARDAIRDHVVGQRSSNSGEELVDRGHRIVAGVQKAYGLGIERAVHVEVGGAGRGRALDIRGPAGQLCIRALHKRDRRVQVGLDTNIAVGIDREMGRVGRIRIHRQVRGHDFARGARRPIHAVEEILVAAHMELDGRVGPAVEHDGRIARRPQHREAKERRRDRRRVLDADLSAVDGGVCRLGNVQTIHAVGRDFAVPDGNIAVVVDVVIMRRRTLEIDVLTRRFVDGAHSALGRPKHDRLPVQQ